MEIVEADDGFAPVDIDIAPPDNNAAPLRSTRNMATTRPPFTSGDLLKMNSG